MKKRILVAAMAAALVIGSFAGGAGSIAVTATGNNTSTSTYALSGTKKPASGSEFAEGTDAGFVTASNSSTSITVKNADGTTSTVSASTIKTTISDIALADLPFGDLNKCVEDNIPGFTAGSAGYYGLDISLNNGTITELANGKLRVKAYVPAGIDFSYDVYVVRFHEGETDLIKPTLYAGEHSISFDTDKFSTYVVVNVVPAGGSGSAEDNSSNTAQAGTTATTTTAQKDSVPKTGEEFPVAATAIPAVVVLAAVAGVVYSSKKKNA